MNKENDDSVGEKYLYSVRTEFSDRVSAIRAGVNHNDLDWMEYFYETITLPSEAYEKFISLVNNPPKPSEKLYNLFTENKK